MYYLVTNDFGKPQYVLPSGDIQEEFSGLDDKDSAVVAMHRRLEKVIEHARLNGGLERLAWESLTFHLHDGTDKPRCLLFIQALTWQGMSIC